MDIGNMMCYFKITLKKGCAKSYEPKNKLHKQMQ